MSEPKVPDALRGDFDFDAGYVPAENEDPALVRAFIRWLFEEGGPPRRHPFTQNRNSKFCRFCGLHRGHDCHGPRPDPGPPAAAAPVAPAAGEMAELIAAVVIKDLRSLTALGWGCVVVEGGRYVGRVTETTFLGEPALCVEEPFGSDNSPGFMPPAFVPRARVHALVMMTEEDARAYHVEQYGPAEPPEAVIRDGRPAAHEGPETG